jgi:hypothetical protein
MIRPVASSYPNLLAWAPKLAASRRTGKHCARGAFRGNWKLTSAQAEGHACIRCGMPGDGGLTRRVIVPPSHGDGIASACQLCAAVVLAPSPDSRPRQAEPPSCKQLSRCLLNWRHSKSASAFGMYSACAYLGSSADRCNRDCKRYGTTLDVVTGKSPKLPAIMCRSRRGGRPQLRRPELPSGGQCLAPD